MNEETNRNSILFPAYIFTKYHYVSFLSDLSSSVTIASTFRGNVPPGK